MLQLEGGDISIEHFLQDQQGVSGNSLQRTFHESCVLVTGVTGMLGSLVLEKLLRSCVEVSKVYVTVRPKDGKSSTQRLEELLSTKVFDRVKLERRESLNKVELLDLNVGLDMNSDKVTSSVNVLIHCGLVVDNMVTLKNAFQGNIKNTTTLLRLAYSCRKLEAFVMVSSTLCHHKRLVVEEKFYPPVITAKAMSSLCEHLPDILLEWDSFGSINKEFYASYVSLEIAEDLIREGRKRLPIAIVRPSMLVASYHQPLAGWLPKLPQGLMRALTQAMQGRLCTLRLDATVNAEVVPADLAAAHVLAVAAHTANTRKNWKNKEVDCLEDPNSIISDSDIAIYNLTLSNHSPLPWKEFFACSIKHARNVPFLDTAWYPIILMTRSNFWFSFWFFLMHLFPAWCIDSYYSLTGNPNILNGRRSRVYQKYQSLRRCCEGLEVHTMTSQKYVDHNTQALWHTMGPSDRETFNFHPSQLDWDEFFHTMARGVRLYCQGDTLDTIPRAAARISKLKLLHYSCVAMSTFVILICLRVTVKIILFF